MSFNFSYIMHDRRGFVHKRLIGAATGFLGGGGIAGAIGGFLGGGGNGGKQVVPGAIGARDFLDRFGRVAPPAPARVSPPAFERFRGPMATAGGGPCFPGFSRDASGRCVLDLVPGPRTGTLLSPVPSTFPETFGGGGAEFFHQDERPGGMVGPEVVCIETMVCPTFADNKKGVLWMNALNGQVFCLPRGVNGSGFGLIRKNRPRRKAFVTAAEISALRKQASTKKKAKKFAALTGQTCAPRGTAQRSRH